MPSSSERHFQELVQYKKQHGHCNVPAYYPPNRSLGVWVRRLRVQKKQGQLSPQTIGRLDALGFSWDGRRDWEATFKDLEDFKKQHGHCNVPQHYPRLGNLVMEVRAMKK